jgi:hypothetical protein
METLISSIILELALRAIPAPTPPQPVQPLKPLEVITDTKFQHIPQIVSPALETTEKVDKSTKGVK